MKFLNRLPPDVEAEKVKSLVEAAATSREDSGRWPYYSRPRPDPIFQPMPMTEPSGKVFYTTPPEPWCTSPGHPGRGGPCYACTHEACIVRTVMEE